MGYTILWSLRLLLLLGLLGLLVVTRVLGAMSHDFQSYTRWLDNQEFKIYWIYQEHRLIRYQSYLIIRVVRIIIGCKGYKHFYD